MKDRKRPELAKSEVIKQMPEACADEAAAVEFFERRRWGETPFCPHCKSARVYKMTARDGARNKRYLWRCRACTKQYTVRVGTIYENSKLPLKHWAYGFWRACASKKGVSAREIERNCQITYKSALFLMHRIRFAVAADTAGTQQLGTTSGTCEVDETFVGGKPRPGDPRMVLPGYRKNSNITLSGADVYAWIWNIGQHPGSSFDTARVWQSTTATKISIWSTATDYSPCPGCGTPSDGIPHGSISAAYVTHLRE